MIERFFLYGRVQNSCSLWILFVVSLINFGDELKSKFCMTMDCGIRCASS